METFVFIKHFQMRLCLIVLFLAQLQVLKLLLIAF